MAAKKASKDGLVKNVLLLLVIGILAVAEILFLSSRKSNPKKNCPMTTPCPRHNKSTKFLPPPATLSVPALHASSVGVSLGKTVQMDEATREQLPYYDLIGLIFAIASEHDTLRMDAAAETWLSWQDPTWKFTYFIVLCNDDPGIGEIGCKPGPGTCARNKPHVILVSCKHGYSTIVTKSTEGFRYLANHFRFKYVMKADIDTMVDMRCITRAITQHTRKCTSFGMGSWRSARSSKVFLKTDPGAGKYPNHPFKEDSGMSFYPPYMVGWLNVWSSDVARFIGMAGLPSKSMPKWRDKWTIDDAAIGTFVLGLDICRISNPCRVATDVEYEQFAWRYNGDITGHELKIVPDHAVAGFEGPLRDDVAGPGDLENIHTESLEECAQKCREMPECLSFEHSPTAGRRAAVKNCQIATGSARTGKPCDDFNLFLKKAELLPKITPDLPIQGFGGPFRDDIPGIGDLANIHTESLDECAKKCLELAACKTFEHSPKPRKKAAVKNCQLNTGTGRNGIPYEDYSLYVRDD